MSKMPEMVLADQLLRQYPQVYNYVEGRRADIIHGYRQGCFGVIRAGSGVGDPPGNKVAKLDNLTTIATAGKIVRRWIDTELKPTDRPILLAVWRGRNLYKGGDDWRCKWENMTLNLAQYMNQSASTVCGPGGLAYARTLQEFFQG